MYRYNSTYFKNDMLNSLKLAVSNVMNEDVYGISNFANLNDERKRKLLQTQQAAAAAERDPETGLMKVSGAIKGVAETKPGGDLYGVDPQGRAFVVTAKPKQLKAPIDSQSSAQTNAAITATPRTTTGARQWGVGAETNYRDMSAVPNGLTKLQQLSPQNIMNRASDMDRQRRIQKSEQIYNRMQKAGVQPEGEGTKIMPLQPTDIRPAPETQIGAPREASFQTLQSMQKSEITPAAMSAFKQADALAAKVKADRLKRQQLANQNAVSSSMRNAYGIR